MALVKINGLAYEFDALSDEAKSHLRYLAFIDAELEQLSMRINLMRISRDEVGRRLDQALMHQSIREAPVELAQPPADSQP